MTAPFTAAATAATLALFPSPDHSEVGLGPYSHQVEPAAMAPGSFGYQPDGLELIHRRIYDTLDPDVTGTGEHLKLRIYRDADGVIQLDHLSVDYLLGSIRVRPEMGDQFDLGLLFGSWEEIWLAKDNGFAQWRVYSPVNVTLLGFSNTDQDDDARLKHYLSAGFGLGGEVLTRVVGPLGLQLRAESRARSINRHRAGAQNTTRHEIENSAELGLTFLRDRSALILGAWGEQRTQWEPRDAEGRDGVDRQYLAAGMRLSGRFYKPPPQLEPDPDIEALLKELRALEKVQEMAKRDGIELEMTETPPLPPEDESGDAAGDDGPTLIHWSELAPIAQAQPEWPADAEAGECTLRFFINDEGAPYEVQAESCPEAMLPAAMQAAWQWRFEPLVDDGAAAPAQFLYTWVNEGAP